MLKMNGEMVRVLATSPNVRSNEGLNTAEHVVNSPPLEKTYKQRGLQILTLNQEIPRNNPISTSGDSMYK